MICEPMKSRNPRGAQIVFTTHNTELMNETLLRKNRIYFADKSQSDGCSEPYTIREFSAKTSDNIRNDDIGGVNSEDKDAEKCDDEDLGMNM